MTKYLLIAEHQVPKGKRALLLFVHQLHLCAGVIEHRYDGRLVRRLPEHPQPTHLVSTICQLMSGQSLDGDLHVVLDKGAYWPDAFPVLLNGKSNYSHV
ncbi:hypothetical protein [Devosia rhizoryzae]|uniref:Transposase n=1 Tax=Devosia rhizoryzae TaxID=2774137 RepID=A0ABX7CBV4_9HYPH|nr:hypothetical protein [Devosia rhizoryzae]QQR39431.1 hypothetical protein JI748_17225 [Devosia rhizoryzae]